jgi:thymidylate synthase
MRSNDVPLGLPFNLASYGLLLELFGKLVNMVPNELIANLGDAHIYLNQIEGVKEQLKRDPFDLPTLRINTEFWPTNSGECGVGELTDNIDFLIKEMQIHDFQIENYKSHPPIKIPLSN